MTSFSIPVFFILLLFSGFSSTKMDVPKKERIVRAYIDARNKHDIERVCAYLHPNYKETFIDGSLEIEDLKQLSNQLLWGKELDSHIELLAIDSIDGTVVTIEESSNYMDTALKRKKRIFKITYTFEESKILHQVIDTLPGYHKVMHFNAERSMEFETYCEQNDLIPSQRELSKKGGIELRKLLEAYRKTHP